MSLHANCAAASPESLHAAGGSCKEPPHAVTGCSQEGALTATPSPLERFDEVVSQLRQRFATEAAEVVDDFNSALEDAAEPFLDRGAPLGETSLTLMVARSGQLLSDRRHTAREGIRVAHHEAGHVLGCHLGGIPVRSATIDPHPGVDALGFVQHEAALPRAGARTADERLAVENFCVMTLCGPVAEERLGLICPPRRWQTHREDAERASLQLRPLMSESARIPFLIYLEARARDLVELHWPAVTAVAAALLEHRALDGSQVHAIIAEALAPLPALLTPIPSAS